MSDKSLILLTPPKTNKHKEAQNKYLQTQTSFKKIQKLYKNFKKQTI